MLPAMDTRSRRRRAQSARGSIRRLHARLRDDARLACGPAGVVRRKRCREFAAEARTLFTQRPIGRCIDGFARLETDEDLLRSTRTGRRDFRRDAFDRELRAEWP